MIKIAICDDDKEFASFLERHLGEFSLKFNIQIEVDIFYDGSTLIDFVNRDNIYDIIFMDIEMKEMNGVEAAIHLRECDKKVLLIYVTSYESFAKEVFEVNAFRFLTKPIDLFKLEKYFISACKEIRGKPNYFQFHYKKVPYRVRIDNIMYFQSDLRLTYIVTLNEIHKCYVKLNQVEKSLYDKGIIFYRTHQSFLVNPKYVTAYYYDKMVLQDGTNLTISENRRKRVSELFCELKEEEIVV